QLIVFILPCISSLELETTTFQSIIGPTSVSLDGQIDENGTLYCPSYGNSVAHCIQESTTYYNECCGMQNMYCCLKFKTWFIITFSVSLLIAIILAVIVCYRYFKDEKDDV
ncbi:hypothetical protein PFISCL1PPCAC_5743, partial [Pristionchus fissidentatus]